MKTITTFNGWLITKINAYLQKHEGFLVNPPVYTADGIRATVQDSFGFRYEITISTIGRLNHGDGNDLKKYENIG